MRVRAAHFADSDYQAAGANIAADEARRWGCRNVLKVAARTKRNRAAETGAILVALLAPASEKETIAKLAQAGVSAFAMELLAAHFARSGMDVLSSQANLAGYKAVIDAAAEFGRAMPMMMTAAGTIAPARVLVMGVGRRLTGDRNRQALGRIVSATDVRPATRNRWNPWAARSSR